MKKKKWHIQECDIGGSIYSKKRTAGKGSGKSSKSVKSKDLKKVYNKFYKDQVSALYKAIHGGV